MSESGTTVATAKHRVLWVDFLRGLACLSMPIYHIVFHLHGFGFTEHAWHKTAFWKSWQTIGLSTFVLVSGIAFVLSTRSGVRWQRLLRRAAKLAVIAALISFTTWLMMPAKFVKFGVLHFFTATILLAPLFRNIGKFNIILGLLILSLFFCMGRAGWWPELWLYPTGMMSLRPPSIDYVPLIPWFGVFLLGMGAAVFIKPIQKHTHQPRWFLAINWLGQHSLSFYFIHQALLYLVLFLIRWILEH